MLLEDRMGLVELLLSGGRVAAEELLQAFFGALLPRIVRLRDDRELLDEDWAELLNVPDLLLKLVGFHFLADVLGELLSGLDQRAADLLDELVGAVDRLLG